MCLHSIACLVCFFIIFVHRCLILCVTCYICLCLCLFSGMCLLFGHVCISIKATKATGGSQQGQQCKILFLSSDGGIFGFLSKPRKQQEVVEPQCSSYWPVATAAFLRPQHFSTNSKANASIFAMFAWLAMFAIFAIFSIFHNICNICDICKICNFQILNHLKPYTGFWSTQYICIPVRSQMTVFIISLSGVAIEFDLE